MPDRNGTAQPFDQAWEDRILRAKAAIDRADEMGWLFAAEVRDGIAALEERLGAALKENLRLRSLVKLHEWVQE